MTAIHRVNFQHQVPIYRSVRGKGLNRLRDEAFHRPALPMAQQLKIVMYLEGDDVVFAFQVFDQVLKEIGVSSAGHRLRIRNAISKLTPALGVISEGGLEEAKPLVADHALVPVAFEPWT